MYVTLTQIVGLSSSSFDVGSSLCVHYKQRLCLLWKRKIFVEILIANCIYPQFQKPNFVSREFFPKRADENGVTNVDVINSQQITTVSSLMHCRHRHYLSY